MNRLRLRRHPYLMKIAATVARFLLGAIFVFFGSNVLFQFLPHPPLPPGDLAGFSNAMAHSHYIWVVGICQVIPGLLLLINRYVPLALTVLAAMIVNILATHIFMSPQGLPMAVVVALLWTLVFLRVRAAFAPLFQPEGQH